MSRWSQLVLTSLVVAALGCVDTAEPTGPVPTPDPEPDPGELAPSIHQGPSMDELGETSARRLGDRSR
jgi:hypothetical protein